MKITIAICTWNRCRSLRSTLSSVQRMRVPHDLDWELLVVNNNCTDGTDAVVAAFAGTLPIRALKETRQGLSRARNHAIDAARGDYIIWTDDDVIVDLGWLDAYVGAFRTWPNAAVFGGPIRPNFEGEPPAWLKNVIRGDDFTGMYALRDFGAEPFTLDVDKALIPYGANFAVRTEEQKKFRYDPHFGLCESDHIRGEETDVLSRILKSGSEGRWVPDASVLHIIPRDRQTVTYLRDYYVGCGRSFVRRHPEQSSSLFLGALKWLWRLLAALTSQTSYLIKRTVAPPEIWCRQLKKKSILWGKLLECRINRGHSPQNQYDRWS
ncbi:MAG: glycosyltransferase [Gammaproteobacteria bacterium]